MTRLSRIKQRLLSSQGQKTSLTILIVGIFFFASTFAQETTTQTPKILIDAQYIISKFTELLSRSWILLASLAGKFMTNDMVYGSWLHLDAYLWKLRNICKNFANFALLGILLREIIQYISKKSGSVQGIITKSVVAGILIQASWFIMAALLDVSSIATAAIATFPTHFIDSNAFSKETISNEIAANMKNHVYKLDKEWNVTLDTSTDNTNTTTSPEKRIESIMPKNDSIAWPLVYIWATTLKIQSALNRPANQDPTPGKIVTTSLLQFLAIAIYCITLILLLITNIIRIGLLRVIIPLSPILVLMFALGKSMWKEGIAKNFDIRVIINAIFKPAIFTWVLSLVLIFIVSMQNIMISGNNNSFNIQWTTFSASGSVASMEVNWLSKININDAVFTQAGNIGKNIFSNTIIYLATIFLLRYLVKIAATSGWGTIGDTMTALTKKIEDTAKLMPVFPVGGGYSRNALGKTWGKLIENTAKWFNMDTEGRWRQKENKEFKNKINIMLGTLPDWEVDDRKSLEKAKNSNDSWAFFKETNKIIEEGRQWGLSISGNSKRKTLLEERLLKEQEAYHLKDLWFKGELEKDKLDEFLKYKNNREIIHNKLYKTEKVKVNSYDDFKNAIYGKRERED